MDAPQSVAEIAPVEAELKKLDSRLYIHWNPNSDVVLYHLGSARLNAGRWEIRGLIDGKDEMIWTWGSELGPDRPYRPISDQTVEFFRTWDAANRNLIAEFERRRAVDEAVAASKEGEVEEGRKEVAARFATDVLGARDILGIGTDFGEGPESPTQLLEDTVCQPS